MKKLIIFLGAVLVITSTAFTYKCLTYSHRSSFPATKSYVKKAPYAGFGQRSTVNGQIKARGVSGYFKPSNGYKYVNSYARSK